MTTLSKTCYKPPSRAHPGSQGHLPQIETQSRHSPALCPQWLQDVVQTPQKVHKASYNLGQPPPSPFPFFISASATHYTHQLWSQMAWSQIMSLPPANWVSMANQFISPSLTFFTWTNEDSNQTYFLELWGLNEITHQTSSTTPGCTTHITQSRNWPVRSRCRPLKGYVCQTNYSTPRLVWSLNFLSISPTALFEARNCVLRTASKHFLSQWTDELLINHFTH